MNVFPAVVLSVLALFQDPSSSIEELIQRLRSGKAEERVQAEQALILRGEEAVPAVKRAAEDSDAEVAARARVILERIPLIHSLTPALEKVLAGTRRKLSAGSPHAWTEVFLEAVKQEGARRVHPELGQEDLLPLARLALRAAEKPELASVCGAIAAWELRPAVPELVRYLDEQDWSIRQVVFDAVVSCRAKELAPVILQYLRRDQGPTKSLWLDLLAGAGCPEAAPEIAAALETTPGFPGGGVPVELAAKAEALEAVPAMLRTLRQGLPHEIVSVLVRIAPGEVLPAIQSGLRSQDPAERLGMLYVITQSYSSRALLPDVMKLLNDQDPRIRSQALSALGSLRLREKLPEIRKGLEDPSPTVRRTAAKVLASFGDKAGLPEILLMLNQPEAQTTAMGAVRRLRAREAIPQLLALLKEKETKGSAAETLAAFGVEEARPAILNMLEGEDNKLRAYGACAITSLDGRKAIPRLLPLLDDADFHLKFNTGPQMLQFLKAKEAIPKFREWTNSTDPVQRSSGLWYLYAIAPEEAVPDLLKVLNGSDPGMRLAVVDHLGRMKYEPALPLLQGLIRDPSAPLRRTAAGALVVLGDRAGIPLTVQSPLSSLGRFELNLFRNPEGCKAWKAKILSGPAFSGSAWETLEEVARRGGIRIEAPPDQAWSSWVNDYEIDGRDLFTLVSGLLWDTGGGVVEEGCLKILAPREGLRFWKRWWAGELLKSARRDDQEEGKRILAELEASEARLQAWTLGRAAAVKAAPSPEQVLSILTPNLKAIPGLEERLVKGGDEVWAKELSTISDQYHLDQYRGLAEGDLEVLAPRALAGSLTSKEKEKTLQIIANRRFKTTQSLVVPFLRDPNGPVRVAAARACLALEGPKAIFRVLPMLEDPDPAVRSGTVGALGAEHRAEANPRIVALIADPAIQAGLISAAGDLQIKEAAPLLLEAARTPGFDGYRRRQVALQSLWVVGGPEFGPAVSDLIRTEFDGYAFSLIFRCVSTWGSREAIPQLLWFLDNPPKFGQQEIPTAFRTLEVLGAREAAPVLLRKLGLDPPMNGAAATAAEMDLKEAIPLLRTQLGSANNRVITEAAHALGVFGDRDSLPMLRKLLGHSDASVRTAASIALSMMKDHVSFSRILEVTRDQEGGYRDELTPLLYLGSPEAKREFLVNFKTHHHMATPAMAAVFGRDLLPSLLPVLQSRNAGDRRNALQVAGLVPGDEVLAELRRMLQDPYDDAKIVAAEMLCRRGLREGVPLVLGNTLDRYRGLNFELNAVRTPQVWKRLRETELKGPVYASARDLIALIAKEAGMSFEEPPANDPNRSTWTNTYFRIQEWAYPLTLLDALDRIRHRSWMVILENDRLRLVPREQALEFWKSWWEKENR
jgi:HEAT repeat protein